MKLMKLKKLHTQEKYIASISEKVETKSVIYKTFFLLSAATNTCEELQQLSQTC
jgi:hypothetical protein